MALLSENLIGTNSQCQQNNVLGDNVYLRAGSVTQSGCTDRNKSESWKLSSVRSVQGAPMNDRSLVPTSTTSIRTKWLRATSIYLAVQLAFFSIIKRFFHVTWGELAGPYLTGAASIIIFLLLIRRLNAWEKNGPSPRKLAFGWGLSMALFIAMIDSSWVYLGVKVSLIKRDVLYDWPEWLFAIALTIISASVFVYQGIYRRRINHRDVK